MHEKRMQMIAGIDHFVLTVASLEATCAFYQRVLGFERIDTEGRPTALVFGNQKINVHEVGRTFEPKAKSPTPGSGDFCLITDRPLGEIRAHIEPMAWWWNSARSNASAPEARCCRSISATRTTIWSKSANTDPSRQQGRAFDEAAPGSIKSPRLSNVRSEGCLSRKGGTRRTHGVRLFLPTRVAISTL